MLVTSLMLKVLLQTDNSSKSAVRLKRGQYIPTPLYRVPMVTLFVLAKVYVIAFGVGVTSVPSRKIETAFPAERANT